MDEIVFRIGVACLLVVHIRARLGDEPYGPQMVPNLQSIVDALTIPFSTLKEQIPEESPFYPSEKMRQRIKDNWLVRFSGQDLLYGAHLPFDRETD